jgi:hypothetical protein
MEKEVTVTPEQMTRISHEIITGMRINPIIDKAPILSLAFTMFGAELTRILFNSKEDTNE